MTILTRNTILLVLAISMLLAVLVGCKGPGSSTSSSESTEASTAAESERSFQEVLDELNKYSLAGETYTIYAGGENVADQSSFGNGNFLTDAVYRRNAAVEKLFSITIQYAPVPAGATSAMLCERLVADWQIYGNSCDLVMLPAVSMGILSVYDGLFADLRTAEELNLSNPWWSRSAVEELTLLDHTYLTVGAINHDAIANAEALLCNKTAFSELYPNRDLYRIVENRQWTREELLRLSVVLPEHESVTWGYTGDHASIAESMLVSSGVSIFSRSSPIGYAFDVGSAGDRMVELRTWSLMPRANWNLVEDRQSSISAFRNETTLFCSICLGDLNNGSLKDRGFEWVLLPFPTSVAGEEYATAVADGFSALAIPKGRISQKSAVVLEALNAYDYYLYLPSVYNYMLSGSYSSDQEAADMMDLILDRRVFNFARIYGGDAGEHAGEYFILLQSLLTGEAVQPQLESRGEQVRDHWIRVFLSFGFSARLCSAFPHLDFRPTIIEPVE